MNSIYMKGITMNLTRLLEGLVFTVALLGFTQAQPSKTMPLNHLEFVTGAEKLPDVEIVPATAQMVSHEIPVCITYLKVQKYSIGWQALKYASGIYYYRLTSARFIQIRKAVQPK
jgi:hypothetical protein